MNDDDRAEANKRLDQYESVWSSASIVRLFRALVPEGTQMVGPIRDDGVIAFFSVDPPSPEDDGDQIGLELNSLTEQFECGCWVCEGRDGPVRNLFTVTALRDPPESFFVAQRIGLATCGRYLTVGHTLNLFETNYQDRFGVWLVNVALPAIVTHCLDTNRLFQQHT